MTASSPLVTGQGFLQEALLSFRGESCEMKAEKLMMLLVATLLLISLMRH